MKIKSILGLLLAGLMILSGCTTPGADATIPTTSPPNRLSEHDLVCLEYSSFSGTFPEDGTGRQVQDVAAMLIRNDSDRFLDYALVTCQIGQDTGTFKVTGLPAGKAVWVLEQSGMTVLPDETFTVTDCKDYAFRSDAILHTDKLSVTSNDNTLTVTNTSGETLNNVCIYYKTRYSDGNFFGGITYMLSFDTMEPNQTVQKQSSHFGSDSSIVRYSFQTS